MNIKKLLSCVFISIAIAVGGFAAAAMGGSLPDGVIIADNTGIFASSDGEYHIYVTGLKAGDVITKKVSIQNLENYDIAVGLKSKVVSASGPLNLFDEVSLELKLDGVTVYTGKSSGAGSVDMIGSSLSLGEYAQGDEKTLDIILIVSDEMADSHWTQSAADFEWEFTAEQVTGGTVGGDNVFTGETLAIFICAAVALMALASLIFIVSGKKRKVE